MSILRLVSQIIPVRHGDKEPKLDPNLLTAAEIDTPVHTETLCAGAHRPDTPLHTETLCAGGHRPNTHVVYRTDYCKERALPPGADPDAAIAAKCKDIPGLVNLKKSRLRLATETREYECLDQVPVDNIIKVTPEGDGPCAGILVSIPLRLTRREVEASSGTPVVHFSAGHIEQQAAPECEVCGKAFSSAPLLQEHRAKHRRVLFTCEKCGKRFYGKRKLLLHLQTHEESEGFRCPFCEDRFPTNKALKAHLQTHAGDLPHLCSVCPSRFAAAIDLRNHAIRHKRKKRFACEVCGKRYNSRDHFEQHRADHRAGRGAHKCDICNRVFAFRSNLDKHRRTHADI